MLPSRSMPIIEVSVEASSTLPMKLAAAYGSANRAGSTSLRKPPAPGLIVAVAPSASTTGTFTPASWPLVGARFEAKFLPAAKRAKTREGTKLVGHVSFSDGPVPTYNLRTVGWSPSLSMAFSPSVQRGFTGDLGPFQPGVPQPSRPYRVGFPPSLSLLELAEAPVTRPTCRGLLRSSLEVPDL